MNSIAQSIGLVALSIAIIVSTIIAGNRMAQSQKNEAFRDCAESMSWTTVTTSQTPEGETRTTTSVEPIKTLYQVCLQDKGYATALE